MATKLNSIMYHDNLHKDYSNYPQSVVTHSEKEPFVSCCLCKETFSTDAWRQGSDGQFSYVPVTKFIVYNRTHKAYTCFDSDKCKKNIK